MPIAFEHVSFSYDGKHNALNDIDFLLEDGEFLGLIGHTGSGKSTLAQLMDALLIPTEGRVLVNGMDTSERKLRRRIRSQRDPAFCTDRGRRHRIWPEKPWNWRRRGGVARAQRARARRL